MTQFAAFIRGINVGGNKLLPMSELKAACESAGLTEVRTFLQSGNVLFNSTRKDPAPLIAKALHLDVTVIVRTIDELRAIVDHNPFPDEAKRDPGRLIVMFLEREPKATIESPGSEVIKPSGRELFIYYPDGQGRSKLTNALIEKKLGMRGTARNWNTVTKLLDGARASRPQ